MLVRKSKKNTIFREKEFYNSQLHIKTKGGVIIDGCNFQSGDAKVYINREFGDYLNTLAESLRLLSRTANEIVNKAVIETLPPYINVEQDNKDNKTSSYFQGV